MKLPIIGTLFFIIGLTVAAFAQDVYISSDGNDHRSGTKEKPVSTLEAAHELIRQYKARHALPKEGGNYCLDWRRPI